MLVITRGYIQDWDSKSTVTMWSPFGHPTIQQGKWWMSPTVSGCHSPFHERWLRNAPQSKTRMELWGSSYTNTICALGPQQFLDQITSSNHESRAKVIEHSSQELHSCISRQYFDLGREKSSADHWWFAPEKLKRKLTELTFLMSGFLNRGRFFSAARVGAPGAPKQHIVPGPSPLIWVVPSRKGGFIIGLPTWKTWFWSLGQMKIYSAAILMWTEGYQALNPYQCIGDASNTPNTREGNSRWIRTPPGGNYNGLQWIPIPLYK